MSKSKCAQINGSKGFGFARGFPAYFSRPTHSPFTSSRLPGNKGAFILRTGF